MIYSFSYIKANGTMYCQTMQCSQEDACKVLDAYVEYTESGISDEDLSSCKALIVKTTHVEQHKQVCYCGKTLSICIQNGQ